MFDYCIHVVSNKTSRHFTAVVSKVSKKIDYGVRNDEVTAPALQGVEVGTILYAWLEIISRPILREIYRVAKKSKPLWLIVIKSY